MRCHVLALHAPRLHVVGVGTEHLAARNAAIHRDDRDARIVRLFDGLDDAGAVRCKQDNRPRAAADRLVQLVDLHISVVFRVEEFDLDAVRLCLCCKRILDLRAEAVAVIIVRVDDAIRTRPRQPAARQRKARCRQEQKPPFPEIHVKTLLLYRKTTSA